MNVINIDSSPEFVQMVQERLDKARGLLGEFFPQELMVYIQRNVREETGTNTATASTDPVTREVFVYEDTCWTNPVPFNGGQPADLPDWFMPVADQDDDHIFYTIVHELGHVTDPRKFLNPDSANYRAAVDYPSMFSQLDVWTGFENTKLSLFPGCPVHEMRRYARSGGPWETRAEAFTDYFMSRGETTNPGTLWFAARDGWHKPTKLP